VASNVLGENATNFGVKRKPLDLTPEQREQLEALVARRKAPVGHVRRARIILLSADGVLGSEIAARVGMSQEQVSRIRTRSLAGVSRPSQIAPRRAGKTTRSLPRSSTGSWNWRSRRRRRADPVGRRG
jgi:hypothetical protein